MMKYLLAAALLLTPTAALSQEERPGWTYAGTDNRGIATYLRDQDWLKGRSHQTNARVWAKIIYPRSEREIESFMTYYEINCVNSTFKVLGGTAYLRNGDNETLSPTSSKLITPESNMDNIRSWVCSDPTSEQQTPAYQEPNWDT